MKFYGREKEVALIRNFIGTVERKGSRIVVITGRRRIGKTRLALESVKGKDYIYFFTKKKKINEIIAEWSDEIKSKFGDVFFGSFPSFEELIQALFDFSKKRPIVLIFDEIQNLLFSEPSAFGTFQKIFDLNKENTNVLLIFLGSSFTLMEKIFKNSKEPLFGRASEIMKLSYLQLKVQSEILKDNEFYSGMDLLHFFSIFDGIPKYMEEFIDIGKKNFKKNLHELIVNRDFIWEEGENLIKDEFGKEYSSYFSILSAISKGRRVLGNIEDFIGMKDIGAYMKNLEDIYRMAIRRLPVTSKSPKERKGRYYINDNFLEFWFRLIESKRILKESRREEQAFKEIWSVFPSYEGRKLEDMVMRKIIEENPMEIVFSRAGKYWDRRGNIEIDIVLMDEKDKKVYLYETKINKKKLSKSIMDDLRKKGRSIDEFREYEIITGFAYIGEQDIVIENI